MITSRQRVSSRGITKVGLTEAQANAAETAYDKLREGRSDGGGKNYPDWIYTRARIKPLLVVHLLAIGERGEDLSGAHPVAAWSMSLPGTRREETKVAYVVNTTWYREHFGEDDTDDDELMSDDD